MSTADHRREAPASVAVHIITVSDTRTLETDSSGRAIAESLDGAGHVPWSQYQDLFETQSDYFFYQFLRLDQIGR